MDNTYDILDYGAGPEPDPSGGKKVGWIMHRPWAMTTLMALAKSMPGHFFGLRTEDGHSFPPIKVEGHNPKVLAYGSKSEPSLNGVEMCQTPDIEYARSIASALAEKYIGQWFGIRDERGFFSKPEKLGVIEAMTGTVAASLQSDKR